MADQAALQKQVANVQDLLGKFVKKPPLIEKNLMRPPFRFLHDIFVAVLSETGFFEGLYTPEEIDLSGLNSREEKTVFLQKTLDTIAMVTGSDLSKVKVNKILAGTEPEMTNLALETLAKALEGGMSSQNAVKAITGTGPGSQTDLSGKEKKESKPKAGSKKDEGAAVSSKKPAVETNSRRGPSPDKKGSTGNLVAGSKGKDTGAGANKKIGSQPVKPPAGASKAAQDGKVQDKKSDVKGQPASKAAASSSSTKIKPLNPYEKPVVAKPMKAKPGAVESKNRRDSDASRRGSIQPEPGGRQGQKIPEPKGGASKQASMSRSSSNQSISGKKKVDEQVPLPSTEPDSKSKESKDTARDEKHPLMNEVESLLQEHGIDVDDPPTERPVSRKSAQASGSGSSSRKNVLERKNSDPVNIEASKMISPEVELEDAEDDDGDSYSDVDSIPQEHENPINFSPSHTRSSKKKSKSTNPNRPLSSRNSANSRQGKAKGKGREQSAVERALSGKSKAALTGKMAASARPMPVKPTVPAQEADDPFTVVSNRPLTGKGNGAITRPPGSARPPSASGGGGRPFSARPTPPRPLTARQVPSQAQAQPAPPAAPGAPPSVAPAPTMQESTETFRPSTSKVPLIIESGKPEEEEDDEYMLAQEKATQGLFESMAENLMTRGDTPGGDGSAGFPDFEPKGHLVQQILDTKRELEDANKKDSSDPDGPLGEQDMDRLQQATRLEMEKLKSLIQNTARVSNPIGKLLDFIQEDIEHMVAEFKKYKEESAQIDAQLANFKEETLTLFAPYRKQIRELDEKMELQEMAAQAGYAKIVAVEERFGSIIEALNNTEDIDDADFLPAEFNAPAINRRISMTEPFSDAYLKSDAIRNKSYLLFGTHPWKQPAKALKLIKQPKNPKNVTTIKGKDFKVGMVPEEFYEKGEKRAMKLVKLKKPLRLKTTSQYYKAKKEEPGKMKKSSKASEGFLAPPSQLDSLEIAKIMEMASAAEAELSRNGDPETGKVTQIEDIEYNDEVLKPDALEFNGETNSEAI